MGIFYTTITIITRGNSVHLQEKVFPALPFAYFATVHDASGQIVLYPETVPDVPNAGDFAAALLSLSMADTIVVLAKVDLEDILRLRFFQEGVAIQEYCTEPGQVTGEELPPSGGDVSHISSLLGLTDSELIGELSATLSATRYDDQFGFGEAKERHLDIAQLLDLPLSSVGVGYDSILRGLVPEGTNSEELHHFPLHGGFANSQLKMRQFVLFQPTTGESEARIAARFLSDVIAWEDDFLEEPTPPLGTLKSIRDRLIAALPTPDPKPTLNWLRFVDDQDDLLEVDLSSNAYDTPIDQIRIFTLCRTMPTTLLARLCAGTSWAIWSYETRRTVVKSDTPR